MFQFMVAHKLGDKLLGQVIVPGMADWGVKAQAHGFELRAFASFFSKNTVNADKKVSIARVISFYEDYEKILIFVLETGEM